MKQTHYWFGIYLVILQILIILKTYALYKTLSPLIYFCNHVPILIAIALFLGNNDRIKTFILVGFIPQLVWTIDFTYYLFTQTELFGYSTYVFSQGGLAFILTILAHTSTCIPALFITSKEETKPSILFVTIGYLVVLYVFTLLLGNPSNNYNCVFETCKIPFLNFPSYILLWIPIVFVLLVLPTFAIIKILELITKKQEQK